MDISCYSSVFLSRIWMWKLNILCEWWRCRF